MTKEGFIDELESRDYSYEIVDDKIIVNHDWNVNLGYLKSLPSDVVFNNQGGVYLESLDSLPPVVEFNNQGVVHLDSLTSLHPGVVFNNETNVYLDLLNSISPGVEFNNKEYVYLLGRWFYMWNGNIEEIDSKRLLNKMIKDRVFER